MGVNVLMYGYARCSTNEKQQDIDRQKRELKKLGITAKNIYLEYESGAKTDRVQFNRLLETVKEGDTIAATEVSRLTRSTKQLCEIIDFAKTKKLKLIVDTFTVDCSKDELDPMTDGMLKMMGVFAEMERNMIRQRVKSGMENARAKGAPIGRPSTTIDNLPAPFLKHYPKYTAKQVTQEELARLCGVTRQSVSKYIKIYKQESGE
jgi:DNA invertase Pin-like site-specific DNA recombinase